MSARDGLFVVSILAIAFCVLTGCFEGEDKPMPSDKQVPFVSEITALAFGEPEYEMGLLRDICLLRKTDTAKIDPPMQSSSSGACHAAARVFNRLNFIGMSKEHVLWILGDPATISCFGKKAKPEIDAPIIYYFGGGYSGTEYHIEFQDGIATQIRVIGID